MAKKDKTKWLKKFREEKEGLTISPSKFKTKQPIVKDFEKYLISS